MPILPIYTFDHPVLREVTTPIEQESAEIAALISDMFETMHNASGIGLAANQVGKSVALTVIDISTLQEGEETTPPLVLINPEIIGTHGEAVFEEGCLSLPDIREEIIRPSQIGVRFLDANFKPVEMEADKLLARVMQHEIDHLHGKYFIDYLSAFKMSLLKGRLNRMKKGELETDYPLAPPYEMPKKIKGKSSRM